MSTTTVEKKEAKIKGKIEAVKNGLSDGEYATIKVFADENKEQHVNIGVYTYPFGNCQNWCIRYFENLIAYVRAGRFEMLETIKEIQKLTGAYHPLLIIDIHSHYVDFLKDKVYIKKTMQYDSSNSSDMTIVMIDTRKKPDGSFLPQYK